MAGAEETGGWVADLSRFINAPEDGVRLMLSLLMGYPLGFLYRQFFFKTSPNQQHLFFVSCGLFIGFFNFGFTCLHGVANILIIYTLLRVFKATATCVILAFAVNIIYLISGYLNQMTGQYRVSWTMPHCVLMIRLIGLVFDVYDGRLPEEKLSEDQKKTALHEMPSLLEIASHTFFFGGYLVGPQFPMRRFQDFVNGKFADQHTGGLPVSVKPAIIRLVGGLLYTTVYQVTSIYFPDSHLLSPEFSNTSLLMKLLYITVWGRFTLHKYLAVWMLTEGSCILTGLTYNGQDKNGNDLWDGCANIKMRKFESARSLSESIESFNINTNRWMFSYVFKRLKFLGNKQISQFLTLLFLALWHGLYSGYFHNFIYEFFVMAFEKKLYSDVASIPLAQSMKQQAILKPLVWFIQHMFAVFFLSYPLVSFCLFEFQKYNQVYAEVYYIPHLIILSYLFIKPFIMKQIVRKRRSRSNNGGIPQREEQANSVISPISHTKAE